MLDGSDEDRDRVEPRPLLPADDRLWRHPSELAAAGTTHQRASARRRATLGTALVSGAVGAMATLALLGWTGAITTTVSSATPTLDSEVVDTVTAAGPGANGAELLRDDIAPALDSVAAIRPTGGGPMSMGVVVDVHGHLLTSASTLVDAPSYTVDCDGRLASGVTVLARDTRDDIAVLQLPQVPWPVVSTSTHRPQLGDQVVAVRVVAGTTTGGAASSDVRSGTIRGRELTVVDHRFGTGQRLVKIDAASDTDDGGLLFDRSGDLVGLLTARDDDAADAFSYATPINVAISAAHRLVAPR